MKVIVHLFILALSAASALAQYDAPHRVLVPVFIDRYLEGGYGSKWVTDLTGYNAGDMPAYVGGPGCVLPEGCGEQRPPHAAFFLQSLGTGTDSNAGMFLYVYDDSKVTFSLRIQDLSRQALTWGTALPVVRYPQSSTGEINLLDLPIDERFRVAIRVYDMDYSTGQRVRLRIFDEGSQFFEGSTVPLVDTEFTLPPGPADEKLVPIHPSASFIADIRTAFPVLQSLQPIETPLGTHLPRVRVQLDPIDGGFHYWAFASVTNNEAQHVTVITPGIVPP